MKLLRLKLLLTALALVLPSAVNAGEFKADAVAVVITPPVGTPIAGSYSLRPSNGQLDDLYAKAI